MKPKCKNCGQAKFYHRLMRPGMILWCKVEDQETQFDPVEPAPRDGEYERAKREPLKVLAELLTEAGAIPVINGVRIEPVQVEGEKKRIMTVEEAQQKVRAVWPNAHRPIEGWVWSHPAGTPGDMYLGKDWFDAASRMEATLCKGCRRYMCICAIAKFLPAQVEEKSWDEVFEALDAAQDEWGDGLPPLDDQAKQEIYEARDGSFRPDDLYAEIDRTRAVLHSRERQLTASLQRERELRDEIEAKKESWTFADEEQIVDLREEVERMKGLLGEIQDEAYDRVDIDDEGRPNWAMRVHDRINAVLTTEKVSSR